MCVAALVVWLVLAWWSWEELEGVEDLLGCAWLPFLAEEVKGSKGILGVNLGVCKQQGKVSVSPRRPEVWHEWKAKVSVDWVAFAFELEMVPDSLGDVE